MTTSSSVIVVPTHKGKSVALTLEPGNWQSTQFEDQRLLLKYIDERMNRKLVELGQILAGPLREVSKGYVGQDGFEAISPNEYDRGDFDIGTLFTTTYHSLDPATIVLFPECRRDVFEEKFGKTRRKIENDYFIKWQTHWELSMVFEDIQSKHFRYRVKNTIKKFLLHYPNACSRVTKARRSYRSLLGR